MRIEYVAGSPRLCTRTEYRNHRCHDGRSMTTRHSSWLAIPALLASAAALTFAAPTAAAHKNDQVYSCADAEIEHSSKKFTATDCENIPYGSMTNFSVRSRDRGVKFDCTQAVGEHDGTTIHSNGGCKVAKHPADRGGGGGRGAM